MAVQNIQANQNPAANQADGAVGNNMEQMEAMFEKQMAFQTQTQIFSMRVQMQNTAHDAIMDSVRKMDAYQ